MYARTGFKLPQRFAVCVIDGDEFTGALAGEQQPARCAECARPLREVVERYAPFCFAGERVDGFEVAQRYAGAAVDELETVAGVTRALFEFHFRLEPVFHRLVDGGAVEQTRVRVERHWRPVFATAIRRPDFDFFTGAQAFGNVRFHRPSGSKINAVGPVLFGVGIDGDGFAGGAIEHVQEAVAVGMHQHFVHLPIDTNVGEDVFVDAVVVVHVARRPLIVPDDLAGFGLHCDHRRDIQVVARPHMWRPRAGVAGAPVDEVEFRIIRAGHPGARAATQIMIAVFGPGVTARFARRGGGVRAPQSFAGVRVPTVDEAAHAEFAAGDAGDQHAIGDLRCVGHGVAFSPLGGFLLPHLFAGFLIECHHVRVERAAKHFAVVKHQPFVDQPAAHHARCIGRVIHRRAPQLTATADINGESVFHRRHKQHAVVDHRLRLLAEIVVEAGAPDRHQFFHRRFVDLL